MKNKTVRILITVFGGSFGLHKFIDKKIGMGILYFFTGGLFGIGWIIDIVKECTAKPIVCEYNAYEPISRFIGNGSYEVQSTVAGSSFYSEAISKLMQKNPNYGLSDEDIVKLGKDRIYEYYPLHKNVILVPEPKNPHDPNAVKVMLDNSLIGYIPSENALFVRNLVTSNSLLSASVDILGGSVKIIHSKESVMISRNNFRVDLRYTYKK